MLADVQIGGVKRRRVSEPDERVDEALWSAYERDDKRAVTETLLQRYLRRRQPEGRRGKPRRG